MSIRPLVQEDGVVREMNDAEYDIHLQAVSNEQAQADAVAAKEAARASGVAKLEALGLTVDEVSAVFGV